MSGSLTVPQNPVAGMYPQPGQAQGGGIANGLVGMMQGLQNIHQSEATTQNLQNQNQQFQQEFAARQAMGEIAQKSIDPSTGLIDWNKMGVNMTLDPRTAFKAPDFIHAMIDNQHMQADTVLKGLDAAHQKAEYAANAMAPAIASGDLGDVIHGLSEAVANRRTDEQTALGFYMNIPKGVDGKTVQGPALQNYLKNQQLQFMDAKDRVAAVTGQINRTNVGGAQVATQDIPFFGTSQPAGGAGALIPNTPTPGEFSKPIESQLPQGGTVATPQGPAMGMPAPGTVPGFNGAPSASQAAASAPGVQTQIHPAIQGMYNGTGPLADMEKEINDTASKGIMANAMMKQQLDAVNRLGPGGMGGGADTRTELANYAKNLGLGQSWVNAIQGGNGPNAVAAAQETQKYAIINSINTAASLLARVTGGEFQRISTEGTPNITTDSEAFKKITAFNQAVATLAQQRQKAWNAYTKPDPTTGQMNPMFLKNPMGFQSMWNDLISRPDKNGATVISKLTAQYNNATSGMKPEAPANGK